MSSPDPAAEALKAQGNALYQRGKWGAAIDAYTDAILIASGTASRHPEPRPLP